MRFLNQNDETSWIPPARKADPECSARRVHAGERKPLSPRAPTTKPDSPHVQLMRSLRNQDLPPLLAMAVRTAGEPVAAVRERVQLLSIASTSSSQICVE